MPQECPPCANGEVGVELRETIEAALELLEAGHGERVSVGVAVERIGPQRRAVVLAGGRMASQAVVELATRTDPGWVAVVGGVVLLADSESPGQVKLVRTDAGDGTNVAP